MGEQVGEARNGPLGIAGVECGEDEVAGFGGTEGHLGGDSVADLADQDDVRVLAQPIFQSVGKGVNVDVG